MFRGLYLGSDVDLIIVDGTNERRIGGGGAFTFRVNQSQISLIMFDRRVGRRRHVRRRRRRRRSGVCRVDADRRRRRSLDGGGGASLCGHDGGLVPVKAARTSPAGGASHTSGHHRGRHRRDGRTVPSQRQVSLFNIFSL